jgi:hypothetical protein
MMQETLAQACASTFLSAGASCGLFALPIHMAGTLEGTLLLGGNPVYNAQVLIIPEQELPDLSAKRAAYASLNAERQEIARLMAGKAFDRKERVALASKDDVQVFEGAATDTTEYFTYTWDMSKHSLTEAQKIAFDLLVGLGRLTANGLSTLTALPKVEGKIDYRPQAAAAREHLLAWQEHALDNLSAKAVVFTDERGHFTAKVPRKGRVAIVIRGTAKVDGTLREHTWAQWFMMGGERKKSISIEDSELTLLDQD